MNEDQIVKGLMQLDDNILNYIYDNYYENIERFLIKNGCSKDNIKDIFQDSVVTLVTNVQANQFKAESTVQTYLTSIARFNWLGLNRKKNLAMVDNIEGVNEIDIIHHSISLKEDDIDQIIQIKLDLLSTECIALLRGNIFLNKPLKELAIEMGLTYDFIRQKKRRCLNSLKSLLLKEAIIIEKYG